MEIVARSTDPLQNFFAGHSRDVYSDKAEMQSFHLKFRWNTGFKAATGVLLTLLVGIVSTHAQSEIGSHDTLGHHPDAEFQLARVKYRTVGGGGSHGYYQPWWAIDYPLAEEHFFRHYAVQRTFRWLMTNAISS